MDHIHLGRSGLLVSRLCLGTMNFGPETDEATSHAILDEALAAGINFVDTADVYGWSAGKGRTEEIIGSWLAKGGGRREATVLATKVYGAVSDRPNDSRLSARHIRLACDASLRRLGTDWIDLYQFHHVDRETPWEEVWEACETLRAQGKVVYFGSSNHAGWHLVQAQESARRRNLSGLVSEQSLYNLLERTVELEVLPACREYGIGLLPWSPLAAGVLSGVLRKRREGTASRSVGEWAAPRLERNRTAVEAYEKFCAELGADPAETALAWLLTREGVTAPVVGPRTPEQLRGALRALDLRLDRTALERLEEIFPGPGGEAPEAYAW